MNIHFTSGIDEMIMQAMDTTQQLCESHFECEGCPLKDGKEVELVDGVKTRCER